MHGYMPEEVYTFGMRANGMYTTHRSRDGGDISGVVGVDSIDGRIEESLDNSDTSEVVDNVTSND